MPLEDKALWIRVWREIGKFSIDTTRLDVKVINQVCYIGGRVSRLRSPGAPRDLKKVVEQIREEIEGMREINDVVIDCAVD